MADDKQQEGSSDVSPVMVAMFGPMAEALGRSWSAFASAARFPDGKGDSYVTMATLAWKIFADALEGAYESVSRGKVDEGAATTFRTFTGLDPGDVREGVEATWSPKQVAFRSFGFGDSDAMALWGEQVQLANTTSEAARAAVNLGRVISDAWLRAAVKFFGGNQNGKKPPEDLSELQRQWAEVAEPILQETLGSSAFVNAHAEFLRSSSRQAKARSAIAKRFTDLIEAPSRQEMKEAYQAIQDLRREIRSLKRNQKKLEHALNVRSAPETPAPGS
jgi:hypothetical protein